MIFIYTILLYYLALTSGYPLETDDDNASPAVELSRRTDVSSVDSDEKKALVKRNNDVPNSCSLPYEFCNSWCGGFGTNTLWWVCVVPATGVRTLPVGKDCGKDLVCVDRFLGSRNDEPAPWCGSKAACVSISRLVHIYAAGASTSCGGINSQYNGAQVQVVSRIFDASLLAEGVKSVKAPNQITLTDGPSPEPFQSVGPADAQNGVFISRPFKYIGGIKECIILGQEQSPMDVYSTLIYPFD